MDNGGKEKKVDIVMNKFLNSLIQSLVIYYEQENQYDISEECSQRSKLISNCLELLKDLCSFSNFRAIYENNLPQMFVCLILMNIKSN